VNDNAEIPNTALRDHVTGHAFVLALGKTHIPVLVAIAHDDRSMATGRVGSLWVPAARGLQDRGLVEHRYKPNFAGKLDHRMADPISHTYRLTRAGWAVFDLLVEAGFAASVDRRRRKVA
jgi:hypothetical protein